jgi:hypothetical protein
MDNLECLNRMMYSLLFQVPMDASEALRRTIEALFITHAETRLNTDGHLF